MTRPRCSRQFVFGYGSLLAAGWTPSRRLDPRGFIADLPGHRRTWGVAMDNRRDLPGYKYYTDAEGQRPAVYVAFLDLAAQPDSGGSVTGVCLPVDDAGLMRLDRRERNYERVDVSEALDAGGARVWAYLGSPAGRERLRIGRASGTAVIDAGYLRAVQVALEWLGDGRAAAARQVDPDGLPVIALRRHELPG